IAGVMEAKSGASLSDGENRVAMENGKEELCFCRQRRETFRRARESIVEIKIRLNVEAARRNDRFIGMVKDIARMQRSRAPIRSRQIRRADAEFVIAVADPVSDAYLAETAQSVPDIQPRGHRIDAVIGFRVTLSVNEKGGLAGL